VLVIEAVDDEGVMLGAGDSVRTFFSTPGSSVASAFRFTGPGVTWHHDSLKENRG